MKKNVKLNFKSIDKSNLDKQLKTLEEFYDKAKELLPGLYEEYAKSKKDEKYGEAYVALNKFVLIRKAIVLAKSLNNFAKTSSEGKLARAERANYKCFCCFATCQQEEYDRYFKRYKKIRLFLRSIMNSGQLPKEMEREMERYQKPTHKLEKRCKRILISLEEKTEGDEAENANYSVVNKTSIEMKERAT